MNTTVIKVISIGAICLASGVSLANAPFSNGAVTIKNLDKSIGPMTVFYRLDYRHTMQTPTLHGQEDSTVLQQGESLRILVNNSYKGHEYPYFGVEVYKIKVPKHKAISFDPADFGNRNHGGRCSYAFYNDMNNNQVALNVSWTKHRLGCSHK